MCLEAQQVWFNISEITSVFCEKICEYELMLKEQPDKEEKNPMWSREGSVKHC